MTSYGKELPIIFWGRTRVKNPKFRISLGFNVKISIEAVGK